MVLLLNGKQASREVFFCLCGMAYVLCLTFNRDRGRNFQQKYGMINNTAALIFLFLPLKLTSSTSSNYKQPQHSQNGDQAFLV